MIFKKTMLKKQHAFFLLLLLISLSNYAQCPSPNNNFQHIQTGTTGLTPATLNTTVNATAVWGGNYVIVNVTSGRKYKFSQVDSEALNIAQFDPVTGATPNLTFKQPQVEFDPIMTLMDNTGTGANDGAVVAFAEDGPGGSKFPELEYVATYTGPIYVQIDSTPGTDIRSFDGSTIVNPAASVTCNSIATDSTAVSVTWIPLGSSIPTVTTTAASAVANTSVTLAGNITADGGETITSRGIVYSKTATNANPEIGGTGVTQDSNGSGTGVFSESISGLATGTQYSFNAYAINSVGTSYGAVTTFTTLTTPLTITGLTGDNKAYDSTTAASASGTAALSGVVGADNVTLIGSPVYTFASSNTGTGITITTTGYTLGGSDAANYTLTQPTLSANITAKALTITGLTGDNKAYDSTTTASASGTAALSGVVGADDVTLGGSPVFTFATANIGTGITITTTGYTISGTDAANYTLTQPTLSADITGPVIAFNTTNNDGLETVTSINFAVDLSFASSQTVSVDYAVTGGTATGGGIDYTLTSGTLTFNVADTSKNIVASIINDALLEMNETIIITLSNPTNATLGTNTTHTYTILDDETLSTNEFDKFSFSVYPNPTSSMLIISVPVENLQIYDINGKKVFETNVSRFSIEKLSSGIYFVRVQTEGGLGTRKFIKK